MGPLPVRERAGRVKRSRTVQWGLARERSAPELRSQPLEHGARTSGRALAPQGRQRSGLIAPQASAWPPLLALHLQLLVGPAGLHPPMVLTVEMQRVTTTRSACPAGSCRGRPDGCPRSARSGQELRRRPLECCRRLLMTRAATFSSRPLRRRRSASPRPRPGRQDGPRAPALPNQQYRQWPLPGLAFASGLAEGAVSTPRAPRPPPRRPTDQPTCPGPAAAPAAVRGSSGSCDAAGLPVRSRATPASRSTTRTKSRRKRPWRRARGGGEG